ncbi:MAG: 16S rRNA (cytosine(967)-C(5))-methyltransferase RsmB [Ruthenibacterium sp.]
MTNPRRAVVTALMKQEKSGYSNLVLSHALNEFDGLPRDKAFVSAAFYGTVERLFTLDFLLQKCLAKPLHKLDAEVRAILRSGLYQAKFMASVPAACAIDESVKLTRQMGKSSAAGMVNAVLRKATALDLSRETFANETQRLSVLYSVSQPIVQLLQQQLPQICEPLLEASFTQPTLCIRINTMRTTLAEVEAAFAKQSIPTQRGTVLQSLYVQYQGDITDTKLFKRGFFHVQGEASQLACSALHPQKGERVLDLCAAPGGKSATLAQYMQNDGTLLCADAAQNRLPLIAALLARNGITCAQIVHNDASIYNADFAQADAVLCDVPCSGLGLLAKKPDIRQKTLEGLDALTCLQAKILDTASRYVKHGGRLVYSTCTVNPQENEKIVMAFLEQHTEFKTVKPENIPAGAVECENFVTLYPIYAKTDGFFVASLERL